MKKFFRMFSAALILALSAACGSHNDSGINPSADFATYIKAYTGDIVATSSTIRIELQASPQNRTEEGLLSFSPSLKGHT